jgi:tetratricopeptide (TPR) repeat protein
MKIDRGLALTFAAPALVAACGPVTAAGPGGPRVTVQVPAVECPGGTMTTFAVADTAAATLALVETYAEEARPARFVLAREQAGRAVALHPDHPYAHYLAGQAALGTGDFDEAARMFDRAVELCPGIADSEDAQLAAYRGMGAGLAFERAGTLLAAGDTAAALAAYRASVRLEPDYYPAEFYLGLISFAAQNTAQAVAHWRSVIEAIDRLPPAEDDDVRRERISARGNAFNALVFAARQYLERDQAAAATELLAAIRREAPDNAEAAYYHALTLNNQQRWSELLPAARRATELAPLSYGAWILLYNAYAGQSQAAAQAGNSTQALELARQAREISERSERLPVQIEGVTVDVTPEGTHVSGIAVGTGAVAPVTVEFSLHGFEGVLGTGTVTIRPPANEQRGPFELHVENTTAVTGVSYRVVGG